MWSVVRTTWEVAKRLFRRKETYQYPEEKAPLPARWRGRIVLTRDPSGHERCVACHLCAVVCPVDCIALQAGEEMNGRRYPDFFRINFGRCIFCGFCEDACPTYAIQLIPDYGMSEYDRSKYPDYDFYELAGIDAGVKERGEGENERPPEDPKDLLP